MVKDLIEDAVESALPKGWMPKKSSDFLVNPTGNFVVGGPDGDCGLTGRKIIVDTYGGYAPHGGGAFSGKDPTKVDRSAAYAARYLAKNVVAAGLADAVHHPDRLRDRCRRSDVALVDTHGTSKVDERKLAKVLPEIFRLTPDQHPPLAQAQPADLPPHRRLRPFRPRTRQGRRLLLGEDRPHEPAQERVQVGRRCPISLNRCPGLVPGYRRFWILRCMSEADHRRRSRRLLRPAQGTCLRPRQAALFETLLPSLRSIYDACAGRLAHAVRRRRRRAAGERLRRRRAPHGRGRAQPGHRLYRHRAVRQWHGQGARCHRRAQAHQHPAASRRRDRRNGLAAGCIACPLRFDLSRSLAETAALEAAFCAGRKRRDDRADLAAARRIPLCQRHPGLRGVDAGPGDAFAALRLGRRAGGRLAHHGQTSPGRVTRPRQCGKAACPAI